MTVIGRIISRRLVPLFALAAAAACSDRGPAGITGPTEPVATQRMTCRVQVRAKTLECAMPSLPAGARADVIVGGQNLYVQLVSSNVHFDEETDFLHADVAVRNLMAQAIGTSDGTTVEGLDVFVAEGPNTTLGSGVVTVANADGTGTFFAEEQPFWHYEAMLQPGEITAPREWIFHVDEGVLGFEFTVFVSTPMPREEGYVTITPQRPAIVVGGTVQLSGTPRRPAGGAVREALAWSSDNIGVATVSSSGLVTGVAPGTAVITATSGQRTGTTTVVVTANQFDVTPPTVDSISITPTLVTLSGGSGQVDIFMKVTDVGIGVAGIQVQLAADSATGTRQCSNAQRITGTAQSGTWRCRVTFTSSNANGPWRIEQVRASDFIGNQTQISAAELRAGGYRDWFRVSGATPDATAPTVSSVSLSPDTVNPSGGVDSVTFTVAASDAGSGVRSLQVLLEHAGTGQTERCGETFLASGTEANGTFLCHVEFEQFSANGTWTVQSVSVTDFQGNTRTLTTSDLTSAGYPTTVVVTGGSEDVTAPSITAFSFAPDTVHTGEGTDEVVVTMQVSDAQSGVASIDVLIEAPGGVQSVSCSDATLASGTAASGTWTCSAVFPPASTTGAWTFAWIRATDAIGNVRELTTAEMTTAGYQTTVVVEF